MRTHVCLFAACTGLGVSMWMWVLCAIHTTNSRHFQHVIFTPHRKQQQIRNTDEHTHRLLLHTLRRLINHLSPLLRAVESQKNSDDDKRKLPKELSMLSFVVNVDYKNISINK